MESMELWWKSQKTFEAVVPKNLKLLIIFYMYCNDNLFLFIDFKSFVSNLNIEMLVGQPFATRFEGWMRNDK